MSFTLESIRRDFVAQSPEKVAVKMAQGFIATAVIHLVSGSARRVMFLGAATAAFGTLVNAVVQPVFRNIFKNSPFIADITSFIISGSVAMTVAISVAPALGTTFVLSNAALGILASFLINQGDTMYAHVF